MKLLEQRSNLDLQGRASLPFAVYTIGTEHQQPITRLKGFSAHQLFLTFGGAGQFRALGESGWRTLSAGSLLTIPAGYPYECIPSGSEPWRIGYASFIEEQPGGLSSWIIGAEPRYSPIGDPARAYELFARIWDVSGPDYDAWTACERLFAFCLFLKQQASQNEEPRIALSADAAGAYASDMLDTALRFLHDHVNRPITIAELARYVGYSQRQLTRLFRHKLQTSPLQYLQEYRLRTADSLLKDNPRLTIAQAAAYVGMSPEYFSRLYKHRYGKLPSEARHR